MNEAEGRKEGVSSFGREPDVAGVGAGDQP